MRLLAVPNSRRCLEIFGTLDTLCLHDFQGHVRNFKLIMRSALGLRRLELRLGSYPCCALQDLRLERLKILKLGSLEICLKCLKNLMVIYAQTLKVVEL
jgi:hypothetical protein